MKILLIFPELARTNYDFIGISEDECLELEYLAAALKQQAHDVLIIDGQIEKINVAATIKSYQPEVVYLCGRSRQENFMLEYCQTAKDFDANIITIIGGLHAQLCYQRLYQKPVDYIVRTFDPNAIIEILQGNTHTAGICYQENNQWTSNEPVPYNINMLPQPDRSFFDSHPQSYRYLQLEHAAWVRTAFSCPHRCAFCHRNKMNVQTYSTRDIASVVAEIKDIKADNIYLCDDDFLINPKRIAEFVKLIKENNIHKQYICYGRADFIASNPELMAQLKDIGLYYCIVGLEATNDSALLGYNKKASLDDNITAVRLCNELGINLMGLFIAALDFRPRDFNQLYKWIVKHQLRHAAVTIYTPELCTDDYERYSDRIITTNPSHWDYLHVVAKPTYIGVRHFYFCYYKLLLRLALRAKRAGIYDFIDYKKVILDFIRGLFIIRRNDNA